MPLLHEVHSLVERVELSLRILLLKAQTHWWPCNPPGGGPVAMNSHPWPGPTSTMCMRVVVVLGGPGVSTPWVWGDSDDCDPQRVLRLLPWESPLPLPITGTPARSPELPSRVRLPWDHHPQAHGHQSSWAAPPGVPAAGPNRGAKSPHGAAECPRVTPRVWNKGVAQLGPSWPTPSWEKLKQFISDLGMLG